MSITTFDTFKFVDRLEKAGMPREQAAAFAQAQQESLSEALESTLATKSDILRLENRIDTMELRLTVKLGTIVAIAIGAVAALIKLA
jgi:hypothetical protein